MLRRSALAASRLGFALPLGGGEAAAAAGGGSAARSLAAISAQMLEPWQQHGGSRAGSADPSNHLAARHFSLFPGGGKRQQQQDEDLTSAAAPIDPAFGDGGAAFAASSSGAASGAAGAAPAGVDLAAASGAAAGLYTPDAILGAAAAAEAAALELATEGAWLPTRALDWLLSNVHTVTGLPWWESIMLTTVGIRTVMLPLMLMQIKNTYRLSQARPEIEALLARLKEEQARGNAEATAQYQKQVMGVWARHKAHPAKSFGSLVVQAPLFIGFFSALRGMAAAKVPSLAEGGALWFTDLTVADPTYALPCLASATFLLTIEAGAADGMEGQPDKLKSRMKNVMRGVAVVIVPFTLNLPAAVFMYWTASNLFSLAQTLVLKVPSVKKVLGLPDLKKAAAGAGAAAAAAAAAGKPVPTFSQKPKRQ
jgi:YidC/Oxa1 family membrane protein insertase